MLSETRVSEKHAHRIIASEHGRLQVWASAYLHNVAGQPLIVFLMEAHKAVVQDVLAMGIKAG